MYPSSLTFTILLLPVLLLLFYCVPRKGKHVFLLFSSLTVIGWSSPAWLLVPSVLVCFDYGAGLLLQKLQAHRRSCAVLLAVSAILQAAGLFLLRHFYADGTNPIRPVGMAVITLLGLGYLIGIFRNKHPAEKSFLHLALYLTFFPIQYAGPLLSYSEFHEQLEKPQYHIRSLGKGLGLFVRGLAEKVILADTLGYVFRELRQTDPAGISMLTAWLTVVSFSLYLYFELLGFADMARGLAGCFGIRLPKQFGQPFFSSSLTQFMEQWSITHILWFQTNFRHFLFPNNKYRWVRYVSLILMWMLIGIWYRSSLTFLLWGFFIGGILALEQLFFKRIPEQHYAFGLIYTGLALQFSWVLFFCGSLPEVLMFWKAMLGFGGGLIDQYGVYFLTSYIVFLLICLYIATDLFRNITERIAATAVGQRIASYIPLLSSLLLIFCFAYMLYTDASAVPWLCL